MLLTSCAWNALYSKPSITPVYVAFSNNQKPLRGKYLLRVSGDGFDRDTVVGGLVCTSHNFPLLAARSFDKSVKKTLANVVEDLEVVTAPLSQKQIKAAKARALITIKADSLSAGLLVSPGFLTKESQAKVQMSAGVQVLRPQGKLFEERLNSVNSASLTIGRCLDAYKTVDAAASKTFDQLIEQIGKSVSQSLSSKK